MSFAVAQGACNIDPMNSDCGCRIDSLGEGASKMDQLKLALTWNRVDVAEEKIFTPDTDWPVSEKKNVWNCIYVRSSKTWAGITGAVCLTADVLVQFTERNYRMDSSLNLITQ